MSPDKLMNLIPYIVSLTISTGIGLYAVKRRHIAGAVALSILAIGEASYIAGYILELLSADTTGKVFWDDFQWLGTLVFPTGLLLFAIEYTRHQTSHHPLTLALLSAAPIATLLIAYTDPLHHLMKSNVHIDSAPPFGELTYTFGVGVYVVVLYFYALILSGLSLLTRAFFRLHSIYRVQTLVVLAGMLFPVTGSVLSLIGIDLGTHRDTAPFSFALSNIFLAWGLFRLRLLDVIPIAHNKVLEGMPDALIVIDHQRRIVDLNPAAREALGNPTTEVIGRPVPEVLSAWLDLGPRLRASPITHEQVQIIVNSEEKYFDFSLSPLNSRQGQSLGYLIVGRDVTLRKQAEDAQYQQQAFTEALVGIIKALNSTLDLDDLLDSILENIEQVVPYKRAEIYLIRGEELIVVGTRSTEFDRPGSPLGLTVAIEDAPIVKQGRTSRQPFLIEDTGVLLRDAVLAKSYVAQYQWIRSYLGIPFYSGEKWLGFIALAHDVPGFYRETFIPRLQAFAEQVAIAIENARLYQMSRTMAAAEERQRLARDIHDSVSQTLFATKSISEMLLEELPDSITPRAAQYAQQIVRLSKAATSELRMLLLEMRPDALEQTDIVTLLRLLCDSFTGNTEVPVELIVPDKLFLPKDVQLSFYRVAQEALNNITRYASASQVTIELGRDNSSTTLCVRDTGHGFDPDNVPPERLGIKLMHEHAANISAQLEIRSAKGTGTEVLLRSLR